MTYGRQRSARSLSSCGERVIRRHDLWPSPTAGGGFPRDRAEAPLPPAAAGTTRGMVWFRRIPEAVIDQVIARGDVFAYGGGFSITDPLLEAYIERVDGTAESVIGLPTALTRRLLHAAMAAHACEDRASAGRCEPLEEGTSGP
jgi:Maf-like protein